MHLGVIGINHKLADLTLREALAKACQKHFALTNPDHEPHHFVLLSTCNRTEVYFSSPNLSEAQGFVLDLLRQEVKTDFDQKLYSFFRENCFHHLCRVTSGLDSAVVAETEIQGQVKSAYEATQEKDSLPSVLHFAFQKALKVGKTLRTELPIKSGMPSLEQAITLAGNRFFDPEFKPRILFVGASHINGKVLDHLIKRNYDDITLCNRSFEEATRWKKKFGVQLLEWAERNYWLEYDWLLFGTRAPQPLLTANHLTTQQPKLIIDLSVPRNVEPAVSNLTHVQLYNIDQLNRTLRHKRKELKEHIESAERKVLTHCQRLTHSYHAKTYREVPQEVILSN